MEPSPTRDPICSNPSHYCLGGAVYFRRVPVGTGGAVDQLELADGGVAGKVKGVAVVDLYVEVVDDVSSMGGESGKGVWGCCPHADEAAG